ncbi:MAG: T9SS type A sorting domain-containing protein, partial [Flavobacteriales bacterium]|nr:T9SS type A sorting domain-containing protein [Flavobacteriales bacterium]
AGEYTLDIPASDSCTSIEIFLYDSWGDGWDDGGIMVLDSNDSEVLFGTLEDGFGPEFGNGWQNEFYTFRLRIADFREENPQLDISQIEALDFLMGPAHGSELGAIGLDDIELVSGELSNPTSIADASFLEPKIGATPNPTRGFCRLDLISNRPAEISVFTMSGLLVDQRSTLNSGSVVLHTQSWEQGTYVIKIVQDQQVYITKLIVL